MLMSVFNIVFIVPLKPNVIKPIIKALATKAIPKYTLSSIRIENITINSTKPISALYIDTYQHLLNTDKPK